MYVHMAETDNVHLWSKSNLSLPLPLSPLPSPLSPSLPPSLPLSPSLSLFLSPFQQTYIGSILSAVNPYKSIDGLYSNDKMELYMDKQLGELPPHIFAIANEVYVSMWRMRHNQCVLIRWETWTCTCRPPPFLIKG